MDDFSIFERDFGLRPQGKATPMSQTRSASVRLDGGDQPLFDDVYSSSKPTSSYSDFDYDSMFKTSSSDKNSNSSSNKPSSPLYDKPVYDENIFDGLPGVKTKSTSSRVSYDENENVFASMLNEKPSVKTKLTSSRVSYDDNENVFASMLDEKHNPNHGDAFDDLLGTLGRAERLESKSNKSSKGFDDLLPVFSRSQSVSSQSPKISANSTQPASSVLDDPFVVLQSTSAQGHSSPEVFSDPLDEISKLSNSADSKANSPSSGGVVFDDIDPLDGFGKSIPEFSSEIKKEVSPSKGASNDVKSQSTFRTEPIRTSQSQKMSDDNVQFHEPMFDLPSIMTDSCKRVGENASPPSYVNVDSNKTDSHIELSPEDKHLESFDDIWLTVSEVPLSTQPTSAPPPSRSPPPKPNRPLKPETSSYNLNSREKGGEFSSSSYSHYTQNLKPSRPPMKSDMASPSDELENFAKGGTRYNNEEHANPHGCEEMDSNSSAAASAAAMKEAMDRAEAKFRHAKEVREREYAKTARNREPVVEMDEQVISDEQERECRENEERVNCESRQRDEEEEHRRLEREKERAREEREKARQAVERATREARERAAVEARKRAAAETRRKSERAAVDRVQAEARERAERASVQRAQVEARERAAAEAKERAEKVAEEARERANAEAREKAAANAKAEAEARRRAERAAVDRAAAEARERAASAARLNQKKNDSARMNQQQRNDNDLESFFSMNSRPSSAPRPRANSSDPTVDQLFQSKAGSQDSKRTSYVNASDMRKTSSTTNLMDDFGSIFGASASSGDFQEVDGETEERRRARLDRHQRTKERAAKALAEKNQRDQHTQWEQEERTRISATLDFEVKRWFAGKEGNLRALLSTLQYVLWSECGWTPVSLTDLITGASVKKVYRKATLCIHPDKVQQKGANLQQKYIAEKVFDLLKEAWNKFNSEELF